MLSSCSRGWTGDTGDWSGLSTVGGDGGAGVCWSGIVKEARCASLELSSLNSIGEVSRREFLFVALTGGGVVGGL